jgi:putative addiction module component (TIGR02574 family)
MAITSEQIGIDKLPTEDRLELLELLWDSTPTAIPDWHVDILKERLANSEKNPERAIPWETVKARLLGLNQ